MIRIQKIPKTIALKRTKLIDVFCLSIFILFTVSSCSKGEAYYQFKQIKNGDWVIDNVLSFNIDSADVQVGVPYDISVEITNNTNYPYQNLWLFSEYYKGDSIISKRKDEFLIADEYGQWKGYGFGSLYQNSYTVLQAVRFDTIHDDIIYIRHGMTDKILHGIEKIGLRIIESK